MSLSISYYRLHINYDELHTGKDTDVTRATLLHQMAYLLMIETFIIEAATQILQKTTRISELIALHICWYLLIDVK